MHIRVMTRGDLPQLTEIMYQSFRTDELYTYLLPNMDKYPGDARKVMMIRLRSRMVGVGQLCLVAVTDESDSSWNGQPEVTGYAVYVRKGYDAGGKNWQKDTPLKNFERKLLEWELWYESKFLDRTRDPVRYQKFMKLDLWNAFNDVGPRCHLAMIAVSPQHQRRGIGKLLVEQGQRLATEEAVPLTLEASIPGRGLYAKMGFKMVGGAEIFDGFTDGLMLWEPEEMKGKWVEDTGNGEGKLKTVGTQSQAEPVHQVVPVED